jgi:lysozyme family protein
MKKITSCFLLAFTFCYIDGAYAEPAKDIYIREIDRNLGMKIEFNSGAVEKTMRKAFANDKYDIKVAASTYNSLTKQNKGKVSAEDLFFVCLQAYKQKSRNDQTWKTAVWKECKENFIKPLLVQAKDYAFIDDAIVEVYEGTVGGQCTPPEYAEKGFPSNKLCDNIGRNTGHPAFEKAMITKFRTEAGCTDDGRDGCARTCYGVCSQEDSTYDEPKELYRQYMCMEHNFTRANAKELAWKIFTDNRLEQMPDAISGDIFMGLWGTGDKPGVIGGLQRILKVRVTNQIDDNTIRAAKAYKGNLRKRFLQARWELMKTKPNYSLYGNGWGHAFLVYARNGCHTATKTPLTRANAEFCPNKEPIEGFNSKRERPIYCLKMKEEDKKIPEAQSDKTRVEMPIDTTWKEKRK